VNGFGDRRALVTGGASGIGHAAASLLSELGAKVVLLDLDADAARRVAEGLSAHAVTADVRRPDEVEAAVADATRSLAGQPDLLVNAAGIYRFCPALEIDVAEWDDVLDTNLRGSWLVARAVARRLVDAERPGTIVNISSTAGLVADRDEPAVHYNASKAGVIALTKQLAVELAPHAIRVNAVCPVGRRYLDERVPLRRLGRPEEVASLIAFLSSDEARYVTGVAVPIDGGLTAI
jgi:NAD(P)-dependent dehydrogenase (short-subunit alcohol dehydrogenase family)